jgi:DNA-binding SARP family transcriptional activator
LQVLGGLSIERLEPEQAPLLLSKGSLALLALLAASGRRGMSRDKLLACRWPDSDTDHGQNALNQALFVVRRALGANAITQSATEVRLNAETVESDLDAFEEARSAGDVERAVALYGGAFLDGFHLGGAPEFERWTATERARIASEHADVLERLAESAENREDWPAAAGWWQRLGEDDVFSARVAERAMRALANAGEREAALRLARVYHDLIRKELDAEPDESILRLAEQLRGGTRIHDTHTSPSPPEDCAAPSGPPGESVVRRRADAEEAPRRARSLWLPFAALAALALVGVSAAMMRSAGRSRLVSRRVVVTTALASARNAPNDALDALLLARLADGIAEIHLGTVVVGPTGAVGGAQSPGSRLTPNDARAITRASNARYLVAAAYDVDGDSVLLRADLVDGESGEAISSIEPVRALQASARPAIELLRDRAMAAVAARLDPKLEHWAYAAAVPATYESYRELRLGIDEFVAEHHEEAPSHFRASAALDSTSATPLVWQAFVLAYHQYWSETRAVIAALDSSHRRVGPWDRAVLDVTKAMLDGDLARAHLAAHRLEQVVPNSEWSFLLAWNAVLVGRAAESVRVLRGMDPDRGWMRGFYWYWYTLDLAYHSVGDYQGELVAAREATRRHPDNRGVMMLVGGALAGLGRAVDAEKLCLDATQLRAPALMDIQPCYVVVLETRVHGHPEVSKRLLQWLVERWAMSSDSAGASPWDDVVDMLQGAGDYAGAERTLRAHPPADTTTWYHRARIAELAAARGDRPAVERALQQLAGILVPPTGRGGGDAETETTIRAEISGLLGDREEAVEWLARSFRAGSRWRIRLHFAATYDKLRGYPPFEALARPVDGAEEIPRE